MSRDRTGWEEEGGRDAEGRRVEPKEEVAVFAANNSAGSEQILRWILRGLMTLTDYGMLLEEKRVKS